MPRRATPKSSGGKNAISKAAAKLRLLKKLKCTTRFEKAAWDTGARLIAGVDEVGRGSLFGPVVAGAVILDPNYRIKGLRDSKLLPASRREQLAKRIREHSIAYAIAAVDVARIDQLNIYWASQLAMVEAVSKLVTKPDHLLIDAMSIPYECSQTKIIHGDALSASIAAASIIAKVERDAMMREWDPIYPQYGLASNKGYYTQKHLKSLREHGPSPLHRQSFAPVWNSTAGQAMLGFMLEDDEAPEAALQALASEELGSSEELGETVLIAGES
ncbi:MAG TPA: ribonuclease HII [Clostridia bacterium]|nr:ribonuclease HII [Clostridia bacterium]